MGARTGWRPVLDGTLRQRACEIVDETIADLTVRGSHAADRQGDEDPFIVVLLAEASRVLRRPALLHQAVERLNMAITAFGKKHQDLGLHGGACGIGWLTAWVEHGMSMRRAKAGQPERPQPAVDRCAQLDAVLEQMLQSPDIVSYDYDLISGIVGMGVYAQRGTRPSAVRIVDRALTALSIAAVRTDDGLTWLTRANHLPPALRHEAPGGLYNLGVAHGVPGVLALLGHIHRAGIDRHHDRVLKMADAAATWIIRQQMPDGDGVCYAHWLVPGRPALPGRMAWCYGGLGLSAALMVAGRSMQRRDWEREARRGALSEAARPFSRTWVRDACLCHGAAGNALIFQRFYASTGDSRFREAAVTWFERTLDMHVAGQGIGGFRFGDQTRPASDAAFLTGSAGVALALLAAVSDEPPMWDRLLLIDMPI